MRYNTTRNKQQRVDSGHQNRAGHRFYVKALQTRSVRRSIVGFGRWRRHRATDYESTALATAISPLAPRAERRYEMIESAKASRRQRIAAGKMGAHGE